MKHRFLIVAGLVLTLNACASSSGEGTTANWGTNSWVNAANLGNGQWLITCTSAVSACTDRARKVCPEGFELVDLGTDKTVSAGGNSSFFGLKQRKDYELMITCNQADTE